ncbi:MAG TPA: gamma-glutamyl-gamma-aminobutyrate hydrolase family protein, partial [Tepidisphaeraceae bacterium]|nr:gamma-glutamyl-gamma-aminobutyrate hydrolase family protein [Tepidisphaeraceae bacterium]
MAHREVIPVLDFGSQYAQLICRRVREQGVFSQLCRPNVSANELRAMNPKGIILSGGPSSVYDGDAPKCDPKIFHLDIPILGICYGMQLAVQALGGNVEASPSREYGRAQLRVV